MAEIRKLARTDAAKVPLVAIRGVVTLQAPSGFFVDDGDCGMWVDVCLARNRGSWMGGDLAKYAIETGAMVVFDGVADPGGYAP